MSTVRGKTTSASTPGSFAPHTRSDSEVFLGGDDAVLQDVVAALPPGHPWTSSPERLRAIVLSIAGKTAGDDLDDVGDGLPALVRRTAGLAEASGISAHTPGDEGWPAQLDELGDHAPAALWSIGDISALSDPSNIVSMAGARASTGYGDHVATELSSGLAERGKVMLGDGSYGIGGAATRGALMADGKVALLTAGGLDRHYPSGHAQLFESVAERGGLLVSEFAPGVAPTRSRFVRRSEVAAALAGAVVIVEASARSGSLVQAERALALGRPVGAVPGPVTSPASSGTNALLGRGAKPIASADDIVALLN